MYKRDLPTEEGRRKKKSATRIGTNDSNARKLEFIKEAEEARVRSRTIIRNGGAAPAVLIADIGGSCEFYQITSSERFRYPFGNLAITRETTIKSVVLYRVFSFFHNFQFYGLLGPWHLFGESLS